MTDHASKSGGLPGLSVRRPWLATVMNLLLVIAGLGALMGVEIRELPNIDRPIVSVRANYPGASPTTVDAEVTSLVENAVARVAGVASVRSSSEEGNFRMSVEFRPNRDLADAANDVREAVSRIVQRLPDGVEDLFIVKSEQDARPIIQIGVSSTTDSLDMLTRRVDDQIIPELTAVDGVAEVVLFGERERVIRVAISPERLAAYGISISEVAETLRDAQFDVPVGSFEAGQFEVLVRADATVSEPARIEALILRENVRLGDLADVYFGLATPTSFARLDGRLVLTMGVVRQSASNTVQISADVERTLRRLERQFPDLRFEVSSDDAVFIESAINEVLMTLLLALIIVVAVIWVFLGRIGATLIPAVAIPVALISSISAIWLMGFSINLITLLALVLATGLVVDDAIVVAENIQRRRSEGMGRKAAAVIGTHEVFFAVIATTVTLIAVFIPISLLPSEAGRLFREFGFVLAITVGLSSFVALSLCPVIAAQLSDLGDDKGLLGPVGGWLGGLYARLLRPTLAAPLVTVTVFLVVSSTSALVYQSLGEELVPPEDRGQVTIRLQGPDGTGLDYTDRQVEAVEQMALPWVENGVSEGMSSISGRYDLNRGEVGLRLIPWDERTVSQAEIEADLRPKIAELVGAQARIQSSNSLGLRRGSDGGITIALTGSRYPEIAEAATAFAERMAEIDGIDGVRVQYQATQPQVSIGIDRARAADLDVSMSELSATLRALIDEEEVAELTIDDEAVPVFLQSAAGAIGNPSDLLNLSVRSESGVLVPLMQLVTFSEQGVAAELDRHGQRRAIEIDASVDPSLTMRDAVDRVRALADDNLPPGIGLMLLGEAATLEETSNELTYTYLIAFVVIFLVLVGQFESLTSAAIVMVTVPFGIAAAILALWLTGTTINIFSQIGVLMLIGIMAKNGILMVEFADQLRDQGLSVRQAAEEAARARLRPIAMTLVSTVLAGLPLILGSGAGAEARASIGWVIFGGLGLAAAFTLFLTPAAYLLIAQFSSPRAQAGQTLRAEIEEADRLHDQNRLA
ncbi:efflux RND transporter permease subunit [Rhodobacteraceae bacterium NNCM2]|nr:efflux RND transporter permease subunit [Coraliihabitans acroporae]